MRYNRELIQTTIKAMKRVGEIRQKREHAFWRNRCVRLLLCSFSVPILNLLDFIEWLQVERSSSLTGKRSSKLRRPSSSCSLCKTCRSRSRRKSRRRSECRLGKAHSLLERAGLWAWTSIKHMHITCTFLSLSHFFDFLYFAVCKTFHGPS